MAFIGYAPADKTSFGQSVITALTNNAATFPDLPIKLVNLTATNTALADAILAARTGDLVAKATLEAAEKTWNDDFRRTAEYVSFIADGDETTIRLAAFTATKAESTPAQILPAPAGLKIAGISNKGNFIAACKPLPGAKSYVFAALPKGMELSFNGNVMMVTVGDSTAYIAINTRSKATFSGLPSALNMDISVFAVNSAGNGAASNGQSVITQ